MGGQMQDSMPQTSTLIQEKTFNFMTNLDRMDHLINEMWEQYCGLKVAKKKEHETIQDQKT